MMPRHVPNDVMSWLQDRQAEQHDAHMLGEFAARHGVGPSDVGRCEASSGNHLSAAIFCGRRGHERTSSRVISHQCGLLGCRVGEAPNPGPCHWDRMLEAASDTQIDISSDEEPLLRPDSGRHVVPRTEGTSRDVVVPVTSGAHIEETCFRPTVPARVSGSSGGAPFVHCGASSIHSRCGCDRLRGQDTALDAVEQSMETTRPACAGALRTAGLRMNRFFSLATDSDQEEHTSDTENLLEMVFADEGCQTMRSRHLSRRRKLTFQTATPRGWSGCAGPSENRIGSAKNPVQCKLPAD